MSVCSPRNGFYTLPNAGASAVAVALLAMLCAAVLCAAPQCVAALEEPTPSYEKGLYDWAGNEWGLQHHFQAMGFYDDNPRRQSYSSHPLPDFGTRLDYGFELGRYLDRFHYLRLNYDAQAYAFARYGALNTVDHTLQFAWNWFDPQIDVTGEGWLLKPRALVTVRKAPEDFIANAAPRRLEADVAVPIGYQFDTVRLTAGPLYRQSRYLEPGFAALDSRDIGGFAELERTIRPRLTAWYLRLEHRSIDRRRSDLFNDFTVSAARLGWRQIVGESLQTDIGVDAALFTRQSNQAGDATPASAFNLSPYLDVTWEPAPDTTRVMFSLARRFGPDTAVSAGAFTTLRLDVSQVLAKDLLDIGLNTRLTVDNRLGGGDATFFSMKADAGVHYAHGDWPSLTVILELGVDVNQSDLPGSSYQARTAALGIRAVL